MQSRINITVYVIHRLWAIKILLYLLTYRQHVKLPPCVNWNRCRNDLPSTFLASLTFLIATPVSFRPLWQFFYYDRLIIFDMDSLDLRRLRTDLVYVYKILFGLVEIDTNSLFNCYTGSSVRGHNYRLRPTLCRTDTYLFSFCANRVINPWIALPLNIYFSSL